MVFAILDEGEEFAQAVRTGNFNRVKEIAARAKGKEEKIRLANMIDNQTKEPILFTAIMNRDRGMYVLLCTIGSDPFAKSKRTGFSSIDMLAMHGDIELAEPILAHGIKPELVSFVIENGNSTEVRSPSILAHKANKPELAELLRTYERKYGLESPIPPELRGSHTKGSNYPRVIGRTGTGPTKGKVR